MCETSDGEGTAVARSCFWTVMTGSSRKTCDDDWETRAPTMIGREVVVAADFVGSSEVCVAVGTRGKDTTRGAFIGAGGTNAVVRVVEDAAGSALFEVRVFEGTEGVDLAQGDVEGVAGALCAGEVLEGAEETASDENAAFSSAEKSTEAECCVDSAEAFTSCSWQRELLE